MTQDEIIEMAEQAGVDEWWDSGNEQREVLQEHLEAFAKLVAAKATASEREACAKVCEELPPVGESKQWERATLKDCAAAIRARGQGTPERGQA
jgi:hypothetical protein